MRALICDSLGDLDGLKILEVAEPNLKANEVLVRIQLCALNFPDVLMVQGKYQRKPPLPFSPGCEFSGIVERVATDVHGFTPGQRVCGITAYGGLAELLAVDASNLCPVPDGVAMEVAASFLYTYSTSLYALRDRGQLVAGNSLLVLGAGGGVGLAAVELGKALGARVVAAASSEAKLALAREKGADSTVLYPLELSNPALQKSFAGQLKEHAGANGFDVVCDPVGGPYSEPALRSVGWGGRHLVIGFAAGAIPSVPLNLPLLKGCQIVGVVWGTAKDRDPSANSRVRSELMSMLVDGRIRPHIAAQFELDHALDALKMMADRKALGKVVVRC